jgi:phosphoribosyl 1,2-cyclic phosphodiesterase
MNIRFLGVGGAFSPEFGNSSMMVEAAPGCVLLVDCGGTVYSVLRRTGWIDRVTHVLITHMHDDHVGSLGSLVYHMHFVAGRQLTLLFPPALEDPLRTLFRLQMGSASPEQFVAMRCLRTDLRDPERRVGPLHIDWVETAGMHQDGLPSHSYILTGGERPVAYSGDLGDPDVLFDALHERGIANPIVLHDVSFVRLPNKAHAYYKDVERHMGRFEVLGYHNDPTNAPGDLRLPLVYANADYYSR